jgi:hypothetical protein
MHPVAIFLGFLIFGYGLVLVKWSLWAVIYGENDYRAGAPFFDRSARQVLAVTFLPVPLMLGAGGGGMVGWGVLGG